MDYASLTDSESPFQQFFNNAVHLGLFSVNYLAQEYSLSALMITPSV